MKKYGLLGEKLGHSYSPEIHASLGDYDYKLYECPQEELESFVKNGDLDGFNVTIPYKKAVIPFCDSLSPTARAIGSVNTVIRKPDGTLYGDNTDAYGFESLIAHSKIPVAGKKAVVLGSGGASVTVCAVLKALTAASVRVLSRNGRAHYGALDEYKDSEIIVNATPVGMYPNNGAAAVDLGDFPRCEGVFDLVYNPARTALMLAADKRAIPNAGGLYMLVAQAKRSAELFTGRSIADGEIRRIYADLAGKMQNIILIGMPGCGKSAVARRLGALMGREMIDCDEYLERMENASCERIINAFGEKFFRERETAALKELGKRSGLIIATGGGCVTHEENYPLLHQNGVIVYLERDIAKLPTAGRPLSEKEGLHALYARRAPLYSRFADITADNNGDIEETVDYIAKALKTV